MTYQSEPRGCAGSMSAAKRWTVTVHRLEMCTSPPTTMLDTTYNNYMDFLIRISAVYTHN